MSLSNVWDRVQWLAANGREDEARVLMLAHSEEFEAENERRRIEAIEAALKQPAPLTEGTSWFQNKALPPFERD